ncbi:Protein of unknown function [Pyronema omphalodes CBS 100304]|uniref:Uncharacterized protein n=1 Tax=Pyronema omphalodes (strain CBS 100304) TaxID=1076935 RepID=U4KWN4_PYROM|nr:Protein of unknown function [Pyronema omphalodes CBS 100304]
MVFVTHYLSIIQAN